MNTYPIRHDYHAVHQSGHRSLKLVRLIVVHVMEDTHYLAAAEDTGRWFEQLKSGGSTHYGDDDNSVQQYLDLDLIPWGAPYANTDGFHIEQMGASSWPEAKWLAHPGTLDRTAFLIAKLSLLASIPIRTLTDAQVGGTGRGVTTHAQCTRVYHIAGGHTDPGKGYPLGHVLDLARQHLKAMK